MQSEIDPGRGITGITWWHLWPVSFRPEVTRRKNQNHCAGLPLRITGIPCSGYDHREPTDTEMKQYSLRDYSGEEDLERMLDMVSSIFDIHSDLHVGDVAWQRFSRDTDDNEWSVCLAEDGGKLVGWGWTDPSGHMVLSAHPSHPDAVDLITNRLLEKSSFHVLDTEIFPSGENVIAGLLRHGFTEKNDETVLVRMFNDLQKLPEVSLPAGFRARHIDLDSDFMKRVDLHREVWHPSKVTYRSYRNVMNTPPYSSDLDWVVTSPDGEFASYCLLWYDRNTGIGLLEPVGTSPGFRGMGLSKAVCTMALLEMKKMGGMGAIVNTYTGKERPASARLYRSIGFRELSRNRTFSRTLIPDMY